MVSLIPEEKISEIKNTTDIVEIISDVVVLKKTGKNYIGLCPFHSEKTPSFSVSPDKQIFHCFGCGTGGNVFTFLTKYEGISFPDAVRMMARRYGISLPTSSMSVDQKRSFSEREALLSINRQAMDYFHQNLVDRNSGKMAMEYLTNRGMTKEIIEAFKIGYALDGWDNISNYLKKRKVPAALVEKSGLIVPRKSGNGFYDRFRNRIIFPIIDLNMLVTGFGGRVMDDSLPKYLNSPETPVYNKSRSLYGLNAAKGACRNSQVVYIAEGYFDALALHRSNIKNSVATLGTALTSEHVKILKGFIGETGKAVLVYDSDAAGVKAAMRSIEIFEKEYVNARILILPEGHDPDSYLSEFGLKLFAAAADGAKAVIPFLIETAVKKHGLSTEGKIRIISDMKTPLALMDDNLTRSLYIKDLAESLGIDEAAVMEKIRETSVIADNRGLSRKFPVGSQRPVAGEIINPGSKHEKSSRFERQIIAMMLQFPEILPEITDRNVLKYFKNDTLKSIGEFVLKNSVGSKGCVADLMDMVDGDREKQIIASLAMGDDPWSMKGCKNLLTKFVDINNVKQGSILSQRIKIAEQSNNDELLFQSLEEMNERLKELKQKQMQDRKEC